MPRAISDSAQAWRLLRTRLVIVDDDTSLLRALALALSAYNPLMAQSAAEALTLVQHCRPDLLLTDYLMPNITGAELVGHARELHPTMKVVMLTGHDEFIEPEPWMRGVRRLVKPCGVQRLQEVVAEMIGAAPAATEPLRDEDEIDNLHAALNAI
jgi:DNA-binding NtrC family response regulator